MSTSKQAALLYECPKCGAPPGISCLGKRGPRASSHRDRAQHVTRQGKFEVDAAQAHVREGKRGEFYRSPEWRALRYQALKAAGGCCQCCGARASLRKPLHVDHIKPRSRFPELAHKLSNLQVLCDDCNMGKGATDDTDWRQVRGLN